jgi:hypothetical protein
MKRIVNVPVLIVSIVLFINFSCKKTIGPAELSRTDNQTDSTSTLNNGVPYPVNASLNCDKAPDYGDSVFVARSGSAGDLFANPVNNKGIKGTYFSWPLGLDLDAQTGTINISRSVSGQRYSVAFVQEGSADTCMTKLIVGGASYMDSVYLLSQSSTTSLPYFNANPNTPNPCQDKQGSGCRFDYNDYARRQGIVVDDKTGFIDLKRTMQHNPFGIFPVNGATILTTIHYQLSDNSGLAPLQTQVKLIYYNSRSDVPDNLLSLIQKRVTGIINTRVDGDGPQTKPPIIIITRTK